MFPNTSKIFFTFVFVFLTYSIMSVASNKTEYFSLISKMAPKVERLEEIDSLELGEGPHWDAENKCLYFVDIFGKAIHKYVPETKKHRKAVIGSSSVSIINNFCS